LQQEKQMSDNLEILNAPLFSYVLASADMRCIDIMEREVFLRRIPHAGLVFQGEIPGCVPDSAVDLSQILLEHAMSCSGFQEQSEAIEAATQFGERLAEVLLATTSDTITNLPPKEKLSSAVNCILNSMCASYSEHSKEGLLEYSLENCPLRECSASNSIRQRVDLAHLSFVALLKKLINQLAPDWVLTQPSSEKPGSPIQNILIGKA
jgi:hypothetical protein